MADGTQVKQIYMDLCSETGKTPHTYIMRQLDLGLCEVSSGAYLLNLAGNNHLLNGGERIEDNDMSELCEAIRQSSCISEVDLRYNRLTDLSALLIASLLKDSLTLEALNLMCNEFTKEGAKNIAESLHDNSTLKMLKLNGNKIGNEGGMHIAAMLQVNTGLQILDLNDCDLGMESVLAVATVLRQNKFIQSVNVGRPLLFSVQEETTVHMGLMLSVNTVLRELHLVKYDLRDFGVERLAEGLYENPTLRHLDLSSNRITRDGAKYLGKLLERNQILEVLELGQNRLENDGAITLANSLRRNFALRSLSVVNNKIEGPGLVQLADCLEVNRTLDKIYIWGNILDEEACKAFKALLGKLRLSEENTDVRAYEGGNREVFLSQVNHGPNTYYYYSPLYGPESAINHRSLMHNNYDSPVQVAATE